MFAVAVPDKWQQDDLEREAGGGFLCGFLELLFPALLIYFILKSVKKTEKISVFTNKDVTATPRDPRTAYDGASCRGFLS